MNIIIPLLILFLSLPSLAADRPVVVELFTSQGCSSCPPADRFLGELAKRDDVLPLSFHVDYWNRLGWKDPFSDPRFTERQSHYNHFRFTQSNNYTPQMVVNGQYHDVGSRELKINYYIEQTKQQIREADDTIPVTLKPTNASHFKLTLGHAQQPANVTYDIWMILFDHSHATRIKRGENRGITLTDYHVVRDIEHVMDWNGRPATHNIRPLEETDSLAILVQRQDTGLIQGVAVIQLGN